MYDLFPQKLGENLLSLNIFLALGNTSIILSNIVFYKYLNKTYKLIKENKINLKYEKKYMITLAFTIIPAILGLIYIFKIFE